MEGSREALSLLTSLEQDGFSVRVEGGALKVSPGSKLTLEQRTRLTQYKGVLLWLLSGPTQAQQTVLDRAAPPDQMGMVEWVLADYGKGFVVAIPHDEWRGLLSAVQEYELSRTRVCRACRQPSGSQYRRSVAARGGIFLWQKCVNCGKNARGGGGWVSREEVFDIDAIPMESIKVITEKERHQTQPTLFGTVDG